MPSMTTVKKKKNNVADENLPPVNTTLDGARQPERIYLIKSTPGGISWHDSSNPGQNIIAPESVEYVRADIARATGVISSKAQRRT